MAYAIIVERLEGMVIRKFLTFLPEKGGNEIFIVFSDGRRLISRYLNVELRCINWKLVAIA